MKYVKAADYKIKIGVGNMTGEGALKKEYDWDKIEIKFTPVKPGGFIRKKKERQDPYLTIITDDGHLVCNTWKVDKDHNWLVTEDFQLRRARHDNPLEQHYDDGSN